MSQMKFVHSIRHSYDLFNRLGRARIFRQSTSLAPSKEFNEIALDPAVDYATTFRRGLQLSQYNILLHDFSYFQFSQIDGDEIRLAFYPSPFGPKEFQTIDKLTSLLQSDGLDFESYSYLLGQVGTNPRRPLVRYEYSRSQYVPGRHPASHLHFGTYGEDRWVVRRKFSPYAFSLHIAKLYFSADWESLTSISEEVDRTNEFDEKYFSARAACELTERELFGSHEENQFYVV